MIEREFLRINGDDGSLCAKLPLFQAAMDLLRSYGGSCWRGQVPSAYSSIGCSGPATSRASINPTRIGLLAQRPPSIKVSKCPLCPGGSMAATDR